jgi:hypothetical protein
MQHTVTIAPEVSAVENSPARAPKPWELIIRTFTECPLKSPMRADKSGRTKRAFGVRKIEIRDRHRW